MQDFKIWPWYTNACVIEGVSLGNTHQGFCEDYAGKRKTHTVAPQDSSPLLASRRVPRVYIVASLVFLVRVWAATLGRLRP